MTKLPEGWVNIQISNAPKYKIMGIDLIDLTRKELIAVAVEGLQMKKAIRKWITKQHKRVMENVG